MGPGCHPHGGYGPTYSLDLLDEVVELDTWAGTTVQSWATTPMEKNNDIIPAVAKKNKLLFLGAIIEMDLQCGFPCGLVCQGVGINGQHLGGCHGHEMMVGGWNKVLGTNGAIM